jgi:hypothetical protein
MGETYDRLVVRFNDEKGYRFAKVARINYDNEDYFYITWTASDDVKIDYKFVHNEGKALDPKLWDIEVRDRQHYVKVSIDNRIWIIEKWIKGKDEVLTKYGRSMKDFLDVKVDYGIPFSR